MELIVITIDQDIGKTFHFIIKQMFLKFIFLNRKSIIQSNPTIIDPQASQ
jgi:hypothetical protein